jgi:hypothetical protein
MAWGIPLLSLLIAVALRPAGPEGAWSRMGQQWLFSAYFTTGYWLANRALWQWLLGRLPLATQTARRLWLLAALAPLLATAATVALQLPLHWLLPQWFSLTPSRLALNAAFSLLPTAAVLTLYEATYFFGQWQANQRRADQLAQAATQAQLDALARQLDPHFLFNSLNTLSALIEPTNETAQHYVEGLADVYRYVLLARQHPTVPLAEELAFVRTYLALQQVRFGEALHVRIEAAPTAPGRVAPLSVQELVENALKHNEASRARPLGLRVVVGPDFVQVENTHQPRPPGLAPSTGTGLANLRQRYALLGALQPVQASPIDGQFVARLPLLP